MCKRFSLFCGISLLSAITSALFFTVPASAELSGGRFLSQSEALEMFGDEIPFQFIQYSTNEVVSGNFQYSSYVELSNPVSSSEYESDLLHNTSIPALIYIANDCNTTRENSVLTVDISPTFSIHNTSQIHTFIALSSSNNVINDTYTSPSWDWTFNGSTHHIENSFIPSTSSSNDRRSFTYSNFRFSFVEACLSASSLTSGYSSRACFYGNRGGGVPTSSVSRLALIIGVPYVSNDATVAHGISGGGSGSGSGGGSTNVNVNVDMSETNGLLGWIWDGISSIPGAILDGIKDIFVPDSEFIASKIAEMLPYFGWVDALKVIGDTFKVTFSGGISGDMTIQIPAAVSKWTGKAYFYSDTALDMSDFLSYSSIVKTIIRIFLWITFLWRLFARLPDIIHGVGMTTVDASHINEYLNTHSPGHDNAADVSDNITNFERSGDDSLEWGDYP